MIDGKTIAEAFHEQLEIMNRGMVAHGVTDADEYFLPDGTLDQEKLDRGADALRSYAANAGVDFDEAAEFWMGYAASNIRDLIQPDPKTGNITVLNIASGIATASARAFLLGIVLGRANPA